MSNREEERSRVQNAGKESEELEDLNADIRRKNNSSDKLRRRMEATIESKAKKRRRREAPSSSAWKP